MRVLVIGASRFGQLCFQTLVDKTAIEVVGVITLPQSFTISYRPEGVENVLYADLASVASKLGLPYYVMKSKMNEPELLEFTRQLHPDWLLVAGWYHIIPRSLRDIAPAYGLHASLLPDYSGGAPLVWAMINGETRTGITLFQMDDGVDSGPIVAQAEVPIFEWDTIADLYSRVEVAGVDLLTRALPLVLTNDLILTEQNEAYRRIMPQRSPEDGEIDWNKTTIEIDRFVRAQTRPYPGAFTVLDGQKVIIWRVKATTPLREIPPRLPGTLTFQDKTVLVATGDGMLSLREIEIDSEIISELSIAAALSGASRFRNVR